ncbi:MAG: Circadian phase modifier [uncultured Chloroflexia bacterium]|uniref:Circadian phase modifier n=1 Tax=uncultured Chloroflexia bacterium TaxID=1672391 RepID=A0A6J4MCA8_9CHLR|nr:MAG: Circadian phase modifier [uncultured Chloroflexia bacterium]
MTSELLGRLAQAAAPNMTEHVEEYARLDLGRTRRKGVPEVVLAERKTPDHTVGIVQRMLATTGIAIVSRVPVQTVAALQDALDGTVVWERGTADRVIVLRTPAYQPPPHRGDVGIISAGTSDLPAADEAAAVCRAMGCPVFMVTDVGVAGLHRLFAPLKAMLDHPVDVIIVAAGMDGALPSVVTGLVDVPVIGLPTAVGYGMGGNGEAALLTMLQTCAPGLAVVNIDNGVGAGAMAALIARQAAAHRSEPQS